MFDYLETDTAFVMTSDLASKRFYPKQVQYSDVTDTKANEIVQKRKKIVPPESPNDFSNCSKFGKK